MIEVFSIPHRRAKCDICDRYLTTDDGDVVVSPAIIPSTCRKDEYIEVTLDKSTKLLDYIKRCGWLHVDGYCMCPTCKDDVARRHLEVL